MTGKDLDTNSLFSFKELRSVVFRATDSISMAGKDYPAGTVVAVFDRISMAAVQAENKPTKANSSKTHLIWEELGDITLSFAQGIYSLLDFSLMTNSKIHNIEGGSGSVLTQVEKFRLEEDNTITLSKPFINTPTFFNKSGIIEPLEISDTVITFDSLESRLVTAVYEFEYDKSSARVNIGEQVTTGFMSMEARTQIADDQGNYVTGILRIPKLKIISGLRLEMGTQAIPNIAVFNAIAIPDGPRNKARVAEFEMLFEEIK